MGGKGTAYQVSTFSPPPFVRNIHSKKGRGRGRGGQGGGGLWLPRSSAKKIGRDREREDRDRRAYRRHDRMAMKFGREVVHDTRHLPAYFQVPPLPRLPVPFLGKRPRVSRSFSHGRQEQTEKGRRRQFGIPTPHVMYYNSTKFPPPPCTPSIGFPFPNCFSRAFPIFFTEHRGPHRPQSPRRFSRSFSHGRHGPTEKGRRRQFSIQTPPVIYYNSTKFQLPPCMSSIGFPFPNCFSRAFPIFFIEDRGPQRPQSPRPFYLK